MTIPNWQLQQPVNALVFDCDGTLSKLEGVNVLAHNKGVGVEVSALTEKAMGETGLNPELYAQRLALIGPKEHEVLALGELYFKNQIPEAARCIDVMHRLQKSVYLVSAGLTPAIAAFGKKLGVSRENIFAVDIHFDPKGNFLNFDHQSPLVQEDGKRKIVSQLTTKHNSIVHIGDGLNDYIAHDLVTRVIGFGGAYFRANIANLCDYYIHAQTLAPLLPLVLTANEVNSLTPAELELYHHGLEAMQQGHVKFENLKKS